MQPLEIKKVGRTYEVWLNTKAAKRMTSKRSAKDRIDTYGAAESVPVARLESGGLGFVVGGKPERFKSRDDARSMAHKIGSYMLGLGDFAYGYVDGW